MVKFSDFFGRAMKNVAISLAGALMALLLAGNVLAEAAAWNDPSYGSWHGVSFMGRWM